MAGAGGGPRCRWGGQRWSGCRGLATRCHHQGSPPPRTACRLAAAASTACPACATLTVSVICPRSHAARVSELRGAGGGGGSRRRRRCSRAAAARACTVHAERVVLARSLARALRVRVRVVAEASRVLVGDAGPIAVPLCGPADLVRLAGRQVWARSLLAVLAARGPGQTARLGGRGAARTNLLLPRGSLGNRKRHGRLTAPRGPGPDRRRAQRARPVPPRPPVHTAVHLANIYPINTT
jgi:hypothetical protein